MRIKTFGVAATAALVLGAMGGSAQAASPCGSVTPVISGTTESCTYTSAGTYGFTVPTGVSSLDVTAVGAAGGNGASRGAGGSGASVEDTAVPVSSGQALSVVVGSRGGLGSQTQGGGGGMPGGGGAGGDPAPGNPDAQADGGGGGGYSGVFAPSGAPLVIGGGGGGGGGGAGGGAGDTGSGGGQGQDGVVLTPPAA
ncbi:MAG TPA: hypothetical protein VIJ51_16320, partial [Solirubrobacteraceae bacterium]